MLKKITNKFSKLPQHVVVISMLIAAVAVSGLALLLVDSGSQATGDLVPRAARIERVEGDIAVAHAFDQPADAEIEWTQAVRNEPLSVGDRVYARGSSRAAVAFTGRNYARLDPNSSLDVLTLADRRTQLALRDGSAIFDLGDLAPGELFEVATPNGAVDFYEPGLYQVGIDDNGGTLISVLSGLAQVVGLAGSGQISKGEMLTLLGQTAAQVLMSRLSPDLAGGIVDDYYGYRYPDRYDGRYRDYDVYLDDPYYYDPYSRSASYQYLPDDIPGLYDLDQHGEWIDASGYGRCWSPRVDTGWTPYRDGYWDVDNVWGPTWVSRESWGWAPYHYGRWAYLDNQRWVWVPDSARTQPVYAPALVAFIPVAQSSQIGWVPLAPGETYVPRYYDADFHPQYLASPEIIDQYAQARHSLINLSAPGAVTLVPIAEFTRVIEPGVIAQVSPQLIAQSQPVLDPYSVEALRQMAMRLDNRERRIKLPRNIEERILNLPVVTSEAPIVPSAQSSFIQTFQVEPVPEKKKKHKLKIDDSGQIVTARRGNGLPITPASQSNASAIDQERAQRITALAAQAAQGDRTARREMRKLEREQRKQEKIERRNAREQAVYQAGQQAVAPNQRQAQIEQEREQRKAQKRALRQQREAQQREAASGQQQRAEKLRQKELRKQMRQQAAMQASQQTQINQQREQRKAQKRAERQQRRLIEEQAMQQGQANQAREIRKAQKRAERQQRRSIQEQTQKQSAIVQPVNKDREQRKAERRAARQQASQASQGAVYQQPSSGQARPDKAQRQAEKQQRHAEKAQRKAGRGNQ